MQKAVENWLSIKTHAHLLASRRPHGPARALAWPNSITRQWKQHSLNSHIPFYNYNPPLCSSVHYLAVSGIIWPGCVTSTHWGHHVAFTLPRSFSLTWVSRAKMVCLSPLMPSLLSFKLPLSFFLSLPVSILPSDSLSLEIDAKCFIKKPNTHLPVLPEVFLSHMVLQFFQLEFHHTPPG